MTGTSIPTTCTDDVAYEAWRAWVSPLNTRMKRLTPMIESPNVVISGASAPFEISGPSRTRSAG